MLIVLVIEITIIVIIIVFVTVNVPIWYHNLVWKIQDIKGIGMILVTIFMMIFQPFMSIYLIFFGYEATRR